MTRLFSILLYLLAVQFLFLQVEGRYIRFRWRPRYRPRRPKLKLTEIAKAYCDKGYEPSDRNDKYAIRDFGMTCENPITSKEECQAAQSYNLNHKIGQSNINRHGSRVRGNRGFWGAYSENESQANRLLRV